MQVTVRKKSIAQICKCLKTKVVNLYWVYVIHSSRHSASWYELLHLILGRLQLWTVLSTILLWLIGFPLLFGRKPKNINNLDMVAPRSSKFCKILHKDFIFQTASNCCRLRSSFRSCRTHKRYWVPPSGPRARPYWNVQIRKAQGQARQLLIWWKQVRIAGSWNAKKFKSLLAPLLQDFQSGIR